MIRPRRCTTRRSSAAVWQACLFTHEQPTSSLELPFTGATTSKWSTSWRSTASRSLQCRGQLSTCRGSSRSGTSPPSWTRSLPTDERVSMRCGRSSTESLGRASPESRRSDGFSRSASWVPGTEHHLNVSVLTPFAMAGFPTRDSSSRSPGARSDASTRPIPMRDWRSNGTRDGGMS